MHAIRNSRNYFKCSIWKIFTQLHYHKFIRKMTFDTCNKGCVWYIPCILPIIFNREQIPLFQIRQVGPMGFLARLVLKIMYPTFIPKMMYPTFIPKFSFQIWILLRQLPNMIIHWSNLWDYEHVKKWCGFYIMDMHSPYPISLKMF